MEDFFVILVIALIIYVLFKAGGHRYKNENTLKGNYENALRGTDKQAALQAGRAYYQHLRGWGNALTIYDEQAIANDLATMKNQ